MIYIPNVWLKSCSKRLLICMQPKGVPSIWNKYSIRRLRACVTPRSRGVSRVAHHGLPCSSRADIDTIARSKLPGLHRPRKRKKRKHEKRHSHARHRWRQRKNVGKQTPPGIRVSGTTWVCSAFSLSVLGALSVPVLLVWVCGSNLTGTFEISCLCGYVSSPYMAFHVLFKNTSHKSKAFHLHQLYGSW
jgi:hypothetical protein